MKKNLIYGLYCPFTNEPHYVGKTTNSMVRPLSHLNNSHSDKINEWVTQLKFLGHKPKIEIIEECKLDVLDKREKYWIETLIKEGYYLLNKTNNNSNKILSKKDYQFNDDDIILIGEKIKKKRKESGFTQKDVSILSGINRTTYINIENGDKKTSLDNLKKVLTVLGFKIEINEK